MNNPSPLIPQGSIQDQKNRSRTRLRAAFIFIATIHIVGFVTLLTVQGCKREQQPETPIETPTDLPEFNPTNTAVVDTNVPYYPPPMETNVAPQVTNVEPAAKDHIVVKGDSFSSIAKANGTTAKAIQDANPGVDPLKLKIGQSIKLPAPTTTAPTTAQTSMSSGSSSDIYKVKSGDTLTSIAKAHGITLKELRGANSLTTDRIVVGQQLKIPVKAAPATAPDTTPIPK
jgi:LysM repeat protein